MCIILSKIIHSNNRSLCFVERHQTNILVCDLRGVSLTDGTTCIHVHKLCSSQQADITFLNLRSMPVYGV